MRLPDKLLDQLDNMTPEQQEEVIHHLSIKMEQERRRQNSSALPSRPTLADLRAAVRKRPQKFRAALKAGKLDFLTPDSKKIILQELGEQNPG